jgi:porin
VDTHHLYRASWTQIILATVATTLLLAQPPALAQQSGGGVEEVPQSQPQTQEAEATTQPTAENPNQVFDPIFAPDPLGPVLEPWYNLRAKADKDLGLAITPAYTFLYQNATDTVSGNNQVLDGRFDLGANWTLLHTGPNDTGSLGFLFRSQVNIGSAREVNLGQNVGDILITNALAGGGEQIPAAVYLLYWRQSFLDNRLALSLGKIHPNQYIDLSAVADDETKQFLALPFDGNTSNPLEGAYSPGGVVETQLTKDLHFNALFISSVGTPQTGFQGWASDHFYEAAEFGYAPKVANWGTGNYRITGWHNDIGTDDGFGISVLLEQEFPGHWVPFARWGYGDPSVTSIQQLAAFGITNIRPFGRRSDMFGIAGAWGEPSNRDGFRDEVLIETFYRIQFTQSLQFSPDIQLLVPPGNQDANDVVAIFGARLKVLF